VRALAAALYSIIRAPHGQVSMLVEIGYMYQLVSREFYETFEQYSPNRAEFFALVKGIIPADWTCARGTCWFHAEPPSASLPAHGWKIHVSATPRNACAVLSTVARLLADENVPFKFALDRQVLFLFNAKRWRRGSSGKFITIYPSDEAQFLTLLEKLHGQLSGYAGPYILSDRRYKDSEVIYYRYGSIMPSIVTTIKGTRLHTFRTAEGHRFVDERAPYFVLPPGITDPVQSETPAAAGQARTLRGGRYVAEAALTFSNSGGVYVATDTTTGDRVLIKEARPHTCAFPNGDDAVTLLKKEHRLLTRLEGTGVAPRPIDFFKDWEHYFLVQEFLDGKPLRDYTAEIGLVPCRAPDRMQADAFYTTFCDVYRRIAEALQIVHAHDIVFGDVSHWNVMVLNGDVPEIRLIDFEGACERGVDPMAPLMTPGFMPPKAVARGVAEPSDDRYGMGALMFAGLMPLAHVTPLDAGLKDRFIDAWTEDYGLPSGIGGTIRALMVDDAGERPEWPGVIAALRSAPIAGEIGVKGATTDEDLAGVVSRACAYIESVATYERHDRLFPADPAVFETNPLSLANGASGVAYALKTIRGTAPDAALDWIAAHRAGLPACPPGLYVGTAGIAWALLELGHRDEALRIARASNPVRACEGPDLYYGAAGWGMAQLKFFSATQDEEFLSRAVHAAEHLVRVRQEEGAECWWPTDEFISCGLAHGVAGMSLFLLYASMATGNARYFEVGRRGIEFVLQRGRENRDGALTWRAKEAEPAVLPYWRWGTAGVATALLRYNKVQPEERLRQTLDGLFGDMDRKYTIYPGRFFGLSGIGEYLLDAAQLDGSREAMTSARKIAAGVLLFRLEKETGTAFPGEGLMRISCDLGTGSAGIALFLHRLLTNRGPDFMLDELLPDYQLPDRRDVDEAVAVTRCR